MFTSIDAVCCQILKNKDVKKAEESISQCIQDMTRVCAELRTRRMFKQASQLYEAAVMYEGYLPHSKADAEKKVLEEGRNKCGHAICLILKELRESGLYDMQCRLHICTTRLCALERVLMRLYKQ